MKKSILFILNFFFLFTFLSQSQNLIKIKGVIMEHGTNTPVPFANVSVCNESIGISTNEYGEFELKIPKSYANYQICVSALNFETAKANVNDLVSKAYNTIYINPIVYELNEIIISEKRKRRFSDPVKLIELALENFDANYPANTFYLQGYYREYVKYGNNNYLNLLEVAIVQKDRGFNKSWSLNQNYVLQYRYNENFKSINALESEYENDYQQEEGTFKYMPEHNFPNMGGNELSVLFLHDPIRRYNEKSFSFMDRFDQDFIANHIFNLDEIILIDTIPVYQISFEYKNNRTYNMGNHSYKQNYNIQGKIFIESNTYAIKRLEYTSYNLNNSESKNYEIIEEYQKIEGKLYLKYLSFSNSFKINTSSLNLSVLNLPQNIAPLKIKNSYLDNDVLVIKFDKPLRQLGATNKRNFQVFGSLKLIDRETNDTITQKPKPYPNDIYLADAQTIFLKIEGIDQNSLTNSAVKISGSDIKVGNITVSVRNLKDKNGNKIDETVDLTMHQFREFFVNEVRTNIRLPYYSRTLIPNVPIYDQKPIKIDGFWDRFNYPRNKPLQTNYKKIVE